MLWAANIAPDRSATRQARCAVLRAGSGGGVVQAPVENISVDPLEVLQLHRQTGLGEAHEVVDHSAIGAAEVFPIPAEQAGYYQLPALRLDAARIVDKGDRGLAQLMIQPIARKRYGSQVGAAQRCAAQRIEDPWIAPDRPEDAVLDVVERERLPFDLDHRHVPRARDERSR